jgi:hypothetical protein
MGNMELKGSSTSGDKTEMHATPSITTFGWGIRTLVKAYKTDF